MSEFERWRSREAVGPGGPLARRIPGFAPRPAQQKMAHAVEKALESRKTLVAESGTGTGKTYAYLVPALLSGLRVIVSTGTRTLQDQLFRRDLPRVRDALELPARVALLKGRGNYLCLHRLGVTAEEGRFATRAQSAEFQRIRAWAFGTRSGDIAEAGEVPEESELWPRVTSTADNCLGGQCAHYDECFVNRARREAAGAELLVVNHHLFFADLALREEGFAQLLPSADAVIFDEAHQLPEIASDFFGVTLSSHQLRNLGRDTISEDLREASGLATLRPAAEALEKAVQDFRLAFGIEARRDHWDRVAGTGAFKDALRALHEHLEELTVQLETVAGRGPGLANCARRSQALRERLERFEAGPLDEIAWFETGPRSFMLRLTPLSIAREFGSRIAGLGAKAWVYTSATLAVGEDFSHFTGQLGLEDAHTARWESPFDYASQALLYVPPGLPDPASRDYTLRVVEAALPVLRASEGRAFLLFTSHRALRIAAEQLAGRLDYPLFVQGTAARAQLLERFVAAGNGVLLGTASFWEGVDVKGPTLSCVVIDKLPFGSPEDPVLKARSEAMTAAGRNPFREFQLPEAVIALKQGAGRLIRDAADRGVLVICDPRLLSRSYGRLFLDSLPPMPLTRAQADVERFFREAGAVDTDTATL
ncbi:helicase [Sulfurifustis variabilis]|uniref:DNA 5'-3' helicase n=2 Tax=Sulfurifustis variabilis TaxID=1675686 RepID=A0A1B4VDH8_9GAMM|nr:helicase [Sulfurifustis variabilis]